MSEETEEEVQVVHEEIDAKIDAEMDNAVQSVKKTPGPSDYVVSGSVPKRHLKKEFDMFELTSTRSLNLDALLDSLNTIPPSSVESERHSAFQSILK